jgi:hypothetical protein
VTCNKIFYRKFLSHAAQGYEIIDQGPGKDAHAMDYFYVRDGSVEGVSVYAVYQFFRQQMKCGSLTKASRKQLREEFQKAVRSGILFDNQVALEFCAECMKTSTKDRPELDQWVREVFCSSSSF